MNPGRGWGPSTLALHSSAAQKKPLGSSSMAWQWRPLFCRLA